MAKLLMSEALADLPNVLRDARLSAEAKTSFWLEVTGKTSVEEGPGRASLLSVESIKSEDNGKPRDLPVSSEGMRDSDCLPQVE